MEPLNNDWKPTTSTRTAEPSYLSYSLVGKFSSSLDKDHDRTLKVKSGAVRREKESLIGILCPEVQFQELETGWKRYEEALNIKSDREKSGSMWTIEKLEQYT